MRGLTAAALVIGHPAWALQNDSNAEPTGSNTSEWAPVTVTAPALPFRQFDKVEITGSSILRKEQTQALPVQTITRQDLQRSQVTSLLQLLQRQPVLFNGTGLADLAQANGGYAAAALRGLPNGTLVLLNGKRLSPFGLQSLTSRERGSTDLSMLPLSAIERIEILTDGASTLYGTDAVAGVINVITRSDIRGLEVSADWTRPAGGAAQQRVASLRWGKGDLLRQGYSVRLVAEIQQDDRLQAMDRSYTSEGTKTFTHAGQDYQARGARVAGFTGVTQFYDPALQKFYSPLYDPQTKSCRGVHLPYPAPFIGGCMLVPYALYDIYPQQDTYRVMASAERVLDGGQTAYLEVLHSQSQAKAGLNDWNSVSGRLENRVGALGYDMALAAGLNPARAMYFWRPDLPALRNEMDRQQSRVATGIKGQWQTWDYHASAYSAQSQAAQFQEQVTYESLATLGIKPRNTLAGETGFITNPGVLAPLDSANPLTAQLLGLRQWTPINRGQTRTSAVELRASRALVEINGRDVMLGVGTEWRREEVSYSALQPGQQPDIHGSRRDAAAYAELMFPLRADLEVTASGRIDRYSDVGSTRHGKLAARWQPAPMWAVRSSWGTGFRAPSVGQTTRLGEDFAYSQLSNISCNDGLRAVAASLSSQSGKNVVCRDGDWMTLYTNGNPDLKPEQSKQATLGLAFVPHRNLTFSADYWRVHLRDTLQFESINALLANAAAQPQAFSYDRPTFNPATQSTFYNLAASLRLRNLGESLREGVDMEARWRRPTDWGQLTFSALGTYLLASSEKMTPQVDAVSDLGKYSASTQSVTPRMRALLSAALARDQLNLLLTVQHRSGYIDTDTRATNLQSGLTETITGRRVGGFTTVDFAGALQVNRSVQLRGVLRNVFNRQPPLSFYSLSAQAWGVNPVDNDLFGRTLQIGLTVRF